ncbi:MAG: DUF4437 domain-containing protein [Deltaproteobacteria bacterium]|nr:DUF4437 domain-containing protein [Deltaproteobacteria bacterium]
MRSLPFILAVLGHAACGTPQSTETPGPAVAPGPVITPVPTVVPASEAKWGQLNPARGADSPKAATLWGDRSGRGPTGFLFHPVDGFSSPPHIHNVSYRGIVIHGLVHNDDPDAAEMWMPAGSFWTQPKGAAHITSARGNDVLAYIEIDSGPYLVRSVEQAFSSDERPINVDASNIVWVRLRDSDPDVRAAHLWGDADGGRLSGTLLKVPRSFEGTLLGRGPEFRAIVIAGRPKLNVESSAGLEPLEPGSYFASSEPSAHKLSCADDADCVIYIRTAGRFELTRSSD